MALASGLFACGFYDAVPSPGGPPLPGAPVPPVPDPQAGTGGGSGGGGGAGGGGGGGNVDLPDGSITLPDGGIRVSDGGITLPDGGGHTPDGGTLADGGALDAGAPAGLDGGTDAGTDGGTDAGCLDALCSVQVLAEGEGVPMGLGLSDGEVYWVNQGPSAVRRAPKSGGPATTVLSGPSLQPVIAVDAPRVFVVASTPEGDALLASPFDPPSWEVQARWSPGPLSMKALTLGDGALYVDTPDGLLEVSTWSGTPQSLLGPGEGRVLAGAMGGVYLADRQARQLTYLSGAGGSETAASIPEGMVVATLSHQPVSGAPLWVALRPEAQDPNSCPGGPIQVRWSSYGPLVPFTSSPGCVVALASDDTHLYWLAVLPERGLAVLRAPLTSGIAETVAQTPGFGWGFAMDATHVYWSERTTGRILRAAKPPRDTKLDPPPNWP
ncbi:hypothetical protein FGE12_08660 [Aggregicoccus sp. 17bor-14]|uniref:hypothetical protein n=1 Tax=Myxococcaceae TaxID=31 RepID=UPI00129D0E6D|nr:MULTISPECIES: hypothetical protein [Myxococcaceae]MBF5042470.1 hypothetical protein [Simulacricoccus sp. 17bor-14]MRI88241.1 hypothetical protein [Aggregicoccus sp. 17bor-14]